MEFYLIKRPISSILGNLGILVHFSHSSIDIRHSNHMLFNHSRFMGQIAVNVVQAALP